MNKRLIILILIFSFGFTAPFYLASGAGAIAYLTKEFGLDLVARTLSRKLLTSLSNGIIERVNKLGIDGGQGGKPIFVQNWKKYLADAQVIGENQFRAQLNYTIQKGILCGDLKGSLGHAFQASNVPSVNIGDPEKSAELKQNSLIPFQSKIKCTIPDKVRADFKKDFAKGGGWDTWTRMLEPQNNLSGATILAMEEMESQRLSQEEARKSEAEAGEGFQGVRGACRGFGADAECAFLGTTLTPAKILGESAAEFIDSNAKWFVSSDELSEILVSMVGAVTSKLENFRDDLIGSVVDQVAPDFLGEAEKDKKKFRKLKEEGPEPTGGPSPEPEPAP